MLSPLDLPTARVHTSSALRHIIPSWRFACLAVVPAPPSQLPHPTSLRCLCSCSWLLVYNKETNAEWRVQPFWPLKLSYLILEVSLRALYTIAHRRARFGNASISPDRIHLCLVCCCGGSVPTTVPTPSSDVSVVLSLRRLSLRFIVKT